SSPTWTSTSSPSATPAACRLALLRPSRNRPRITATLLLHECPLIVMITGGRLPPPSASTTSGGTSSPRIGSGGSTWARNFMLCSSPSCQLATRVSIPVRPAAARGSASRRRGGRVRARVRSLRSSTTDGHEMRHCGRRPCAALRSWESSLLLPPAPRVQVLEEFVRSEFDLLVPPLGGAVVAGDQAHPVHPPEVAVHKRVARLRLVCDALGQAQVPDRVVGKRVRLQERVLLAGARLHGLPARPENVLVRVDQPLRVHNRVLVQRVGGDPPIVTPART